MPAKPLNAAAKNTSIRRESYCYRRYQGGHGGFTTKDLATPCRSDWLSMVSNESTLFLGRRRNTHMEDDYHTVRSLLVRCNPVCRVSQLSAAYEAFFPWSPNFVQRDIGRCLPHHQNHSFVRVAPFQKSISDQIPSRISESLDFTLSAVVNCPDARGELPYS